ncbi:MAG: hypothetical protein MI756_14235 [Chromatiales bacterium]|nr:hypothetical protein [Chromatiales bacterium]
MGAVWLGFIAVILVFKEFFPEYLGEAIYGWAATAILIAALNEISQRKVKKGHRRAKK